MSKLPPLDASFWVMKICATTLGETAGDLLSMTLGIGYAASSALLLGIFATTLGAQLWTDTYRPLLYWAVILSTSTAGTTMSDFMDRTLGLGYATGSAILLVLLVAVLAIWRAVEGSLAVAEVRSRRAEVFYWTAILVSNTLGTALGDFLADDSGLGFAGGALLIAALLGVVLVLRAATPVSRVVLFWLAFVLTRPFGATLGDLMTKMPAAGGLGFGTMMASAVLATTLAAGILLTSGRSARAPAARTRGE